MPHRHVGVGECRVTEIVDADGTASYRIDQADDRVMIASSLHRTVLDHTGLLDVASATPRTLTLHTPVATVTYRLDDWCGLCDAWEARRL